MAITFRHGPRGITEARGAALYGARRGAEQPWWDRFGASMRTAAQMYMGRRREEAAEERMRMGARFQEQAGEARLGREKEMVDYRGEAAVGLIDDTAQARRKLEEEDIRRDEQKLDEAEKSGFWTPEEAAPERDAIMRRKYRLPPKPPEITIQTELQKRMTTNESGQSLILQPDGKITVSQPAKAAEEEAPRQRRRPGEPRDIKLVREVDTRLKQEMSEREAAEKPAMSAEEQRRRRSEIYDELDAFLAGDEPSVGGPRVEGFGPTERQPGRPLPPFGAPPGEEGAPPTATAPMAPLQDVEVTDFGTGKKQRIGWHALGGLFKGQELQPYAKELQQRGLPPEQVKQFMYEYVAHQERRKARAGDQKALEREEAGWRQYLKRTLGA